MTRRRVGHTSPSWINVFVAHWLLGAAAAALAEEPIVIRAHVLSPDGKPAAGAHVAVIARRTAVGRGSDLDLGWGPGVLGEAIADEKGEYVLRLAGVSQKTHGDAHLIARRDGSAVAWRKLKLDAAQADLTIKLEPEELISARLIDVEGRPAAGARMSIVAMIEPAENMIDNRSLWYDHTGSAPAAWAAPITSDEAGRFVVRSVAAKKGVLLDVAADDRFAQQQIALNTGWEEQRGENDVTYRSLLKNLKPGEEALLVLAPAQVFQGTVRYADSGEAAPHARISIWASQREAGSMMTHDGTADDQGYYHVTPRPGIHFGLTAYPPRGTPYLARKSKTIVWEGGERIKQLNMTLPRGVLVRGRIVEAGGGNPVPGAHLEYMPEASNNRNAANDIVTGWQCVEVTDEDGGFSMAVLPGPGRLLVNGPDGQYVLREVGNRELYSGKPGGTRYYTHAVMKLDPEVGRDAVDVRIELEHGGTVKGRIVDEAGKPIDEALVISRLNIAPAAATFWRGPTTPTLGGQFELTGLAEGVEYPIYFLDPKRRLGATEVVKAGDIERTVVLKPCGTARLRLVDGEGEPMPASYGLPEMVVTPGAYRYDREALDRGELASDADFVSNIDRTNNPPRSLDENGARTMKALIPGATYRIMGMRDGQITLVKEFQVKPGESVDFGDIVVDRE